MSTVQLRVGDMFDGPSDLIVLPCSTEGTITSFVRQKLVNYRIPYPRPGLKLGDVHIVPFEGGENIAQYVAYAASVDSNTSSPAAIRRIGQQLGAFTVQGPAARLIAAPLLGAGAGGLQSEVVVQALRDGFRVSAHSDAVLQISILHEPVYKRVRDSLELRPSTELNETPTNRSAGATTRKPLRVFISYSHSSPEHERWVESLGTFLRQQGIDARLDVWHLRRGMDLPQFMTNELALADRVILISDERYAEKADGRVGGVGWETMIVQGDISKLPPDSIKYLVIVCAEAVETGLPKYLATKFVIHWPHARVEERNRQTLLRELYDHVGPPPLGEPPAFI